MDIAALPQREPVRLHWRFDALRARAKAFLESEREQLALWVVVGLGGGIAAWLSLPGARLWAGFMLICGGGALAGGLFVSGRLGRAIAAFCAMLAVGTALIWLRSEWIAASRLERTAIVLFEAQVERVQPLAARDSLRLLLKPRDPTLPPLLRVNMPDEEVPEGLGAGAIIRLRARLTPPMAMPLPGAHDYGRDAWFAGIGATGRALGKVEVLHPAKAGGLDGIRASLDEHIRSRLEESEGAIATALATGDQGCDAR
jgi:competence protein ComEC